MAWTLPIRADASASARTRVVYPGNFQKDATVRPSHGRPRGHRPTVRPFVIVRVTTLGESGRTVVGLLRAGGVVVPADGLT
jgi:hypothetical protein